MARWKQWDSAWTIVLIVAILSPLVISRPSADVELGASPIIVKNQHNNLSKTTEAPNRSTTVRSKQESSFPSTMSILTISPRDVKNSTPLIGESIKMVANQLLHSTKSPVEVAHVEDTRVPPKIKTQIANKNKTKAKTEKNEDKIENSHAGIAMPVTMEELEQELPPNNHPKETSTSHEGISTWILLSNPSSTLKPPKDTTKSEIASSNEDTTKKPKPSNSKNKPKKPQPNGSKINAPKRPIIASTNKSDLVAGGSAMNENVFNKIKATVLANVQKNKNANANRTTTIAPITAVTTTSHIVTKKNSTTKAPTTASVIDITTVTEKVNKPKKKKKNKNKNKTQTFNTESASLPMEPKEQEIELEVSTPPATTKKPKRSSTKRKKNKTKKRKPSSAAKPEDLEASQSDISNSTKLSKPANKIDNPISSQIYNYLSREVMPTVGVGIVGLAGLVGLASYFLYPFAGPVRRVLDVDKKDDIYRHNAEEYANDGNGQAEEEMLGTVLAGMPAKTNRLNPYVNQTPVRQQSVKETDQNIRYRHVSTNSDVNSFNTHYSQQKTGIAHAAVYSDAISYNPHYEPKNNYPIENKHVVYASENQKDYNAFSPLEPMYNAPQTGPSGPTSYGSDSSNTVLYGTKPTQQSNFEPVYPFEGQVFSETTNFPMTYPPTSMYLGSNNESEDPSETSYIETQSNEKKEPQFVVGNVPKELIQAVTPAVVPEHGPRKIDRKKRSLADSLEEILRKAKDESKDIFISNEIDEALGIKSDDSIPMATLQTEFKNISNTTVTKGPTVSNSDTIYNNTSVIETLKDSKTTPLYPVYTVYPVAKEIPKDNSSLEIHLDALPPKVVTQLPNEIVESISTVPFNSNTMASDIISTTEPALKNDDTTTKSFRVYEVFTSGQIALAGNSTSKSTGANGMQNTLQDTTDKSTTVKPSDETTKNEADSSSTATESPIESNKNDSTSNPKTEKPVKYTPHVPPYSTSTISYPQDGSILTFIKRLLEFKFKLGMSILQTTSDSLTRYLKSMESTVERVAKASGNNKYHKYRK